MNPVKKMSSTPIDCREASRTDLPDILRLLAQPDLDDGEALPLAEAERMFDRMARYPDYKMYLAIRGDRVVGCFALLIMDNLGHLGAPSGVIEDVAVDPQSHGQGIGRAMMRHALRMGADKGCYKVALSSNLTRTRAHAFYEALGFERHGYSFRVLTDPSLPDDAQGSRAQHDE